MPHHDKHQSRRARIQMYHQCVHHLNPDDHHLPQTQDHRDRHRKSSGQVPNHLHLEPHLARVAIYAVLRPPRKRTWTLRKMCVPWRTKQTTYGGTRVPIRQSILRSGCPPIQPFSSLHDLQIQTHPRGDRKLQTFLCPFPQMTHRGSRETNDCGRAQWLQSRMDGVLLRVMGGRVDVDGRVQ